MDRADQARDQLRSDMTNLDDIEIARAILDPALATHNPALESKVALVKAKMAEINARMAARAAQGSPFAQFHQAVMANHFPHLLSPNTNRASRPPGCCLFFRHFIATEEQT